MQNAISSSARCACILESYSSARTINWHSRAQSRNALGFDVTCIHGMMISLYRKARHHRFKLDILRCLHYWMGYHSVLGVGRPIVIGSSARRACILGSYCNTREKHHT
jgi:hypothetical protein